MLAVFTVLVLKEGRQRPVREIVASMTVLRVARTSSVMSAHSGQPTNPETESMLTKCSGGEFD